MFIGLSVGNVLTPDDLTLMAKDPIVFALANPDPELPPELGHRHCRIYASGRSDYPNSVNNLLAFPGMFRGDLDARVTTIPGCRVRLGRSRAGTFLERALHHSQRVRSTRRADGDQRRISSCP